MDWYEFVCKLIQHSGPFRGSYITSHRHITLHSNGLFAMHCIGLICTICTSCISQKMWIISHNAALMNALHFVCSVQCSALWRDEYCTVQHIAHPFPWGRGGIVRSQRLPSGGNLSGISGFKDWYCHYLQRCHHGATRFLKHHHTKSPDSGDFWLKHSIYDD